MECLLKNIDPAELLISAVVQSRAGRPIDFRLQGGLRAVSGFEVQETGDVEHEFGDVNAAPRAYDPMMLGLMSQDRMKQDGVA